MIQSSLSTKRYAVFISYRRGLGLFQARMLFNELKDILGADYPIFLDLEENRGGDFTQRIYPAIRRSNRFLWLITEDSFDEGNGYYLREIKTAIEAKCSIVPVLFVSTKQYLSELPDELRPVLQNCNFITYSSEYHNDFIRKLIKDFLKINVKTPAPLPPPPPRQHPLLKLITSIDYVKVAGKLLDFIGTVLGFVCRNGKNVFLVCVAFVLLSTMWRGCSDSDRQEERTSANQQEKKERKTKETGVLLDDNPQRLQFTPITSLRPIKMGLKTNFNICKNIYANGVSPDGSKMVLAGNGNEAILIDTASGDIIDRIQCAGNVYYAAFTKDSHSLIIGSANAAQVIDLDEQGIDFSVYDNKDINAAVVDLASHRLISASGDGAIHIADINGKEAAKTIKCDSPVYVLDISPDGEKLISGCKNGTFRVHSNDAKQIKLMQRNFSDSVMTAKFSPDGKFIAIGTKSNECVVIEESTGKTVYSGAGRTLAFSPEGKFLAAYNENSHIINIVDIRSGRQLCSAKSAYFNNTYWMTFSASGRSLLVGNEVWDTSALYQKKSEAEPQHQTHNTKPAQETQSTPQMSFSEMLEDPFFSASPQKETPNR